MKKNNELSVQILSKDVLGAKGLEALLSSSNWEVVNDAPSSALLVDYTTDFEPSWDEGAVVLALVKDEKMAQKAFEKGARGILNRQGDPNRIPIALSALERGIFLFDSTFAHTLVSESFIDEDVEVSERERDVLSLMAEGLSNKEIAGVLNLSVHTIKFHVQAILKKLDAASRTEAAVRAVRLRLV